MKKKKFNRFQFSHPQKICTHIHINRFSFSLTYIVGNIEWKFLSLCISSDNSLITYLYIFVYEHAASAHDSISFHSIVQTHNFLF